LLSSIPSLIVGTIAVLLTAGLFVYQRHIKRKHGLKDKEKRSKELQKEISVIYKTEDAKDPVIADKVKLKQKEMMDLTFGMMKTNMMSMIWFMLLVMVIFLVVIGKYTYSPFPVGKFWIFTPVIAWYILISLATNIVMKLTFVLLEKKEIIRA
jgi:uncharacterized membrane protein (DUF106 family)